MNAVGEILYSVIPEKGSEWFSSFSRVSIT